MIAHVVLFEPKADISPEQKRAFITAVREAVLSVPEIRVARVGRSADLGLTTDTNGGQTTYSYVGIFEFADREGLSRYLDHGAHDALRTLFWRFCQNTVIVDAEMVDVRTDDAFLLVE